MYSSVYCHKTGKTYGSAKFEAPGTIGCEDEMRAYYLLKTEQCYFPKGQSDELDCLTNSEITGAEVKAIRMTKQDIGVLEWEGNTAAGRSTGGRCVLRRA